MLLFGCELCRVAFDIRRCSQLLSKCHTRPRLAKNLKNILLVYQCRANDIGDHTNNQYQIKYKVSTMSSGSAMEALVHLTAKLALDHPRHTVNRKSDGVVQWRENADVVVTKSPVAVVADGCGILLESIRIKYGYSSALLIMETITFFITIYDQRM